METSSTTKLTFSAPACRWFSILPQTSEANASAAALSTSMTPDPDTRWSLSGFNLWLLRGRLKQAEALQLVGEAGTVRGVQPRHG